MRISDWSSDVCSSDLGLIETAKSFIHRWRRPKSGGAPGERFEPGRVCALAVGAQAHGPALGGRHDAADWRGARLADAGEAARHPDSHLEGFIEWQIGRASCRERVCQYVSMSVVAVSLQKTVTVLIHW